MAKFLKATTEIDDRNAIKDHINAMGINLCAGELEEIHEHLLILRAQSADVDSSNKASVKTEPVTEPEVVL